jgi:hypothetical protein
MPELSRTDAVAWERGALRWTSVVERFLHGALVAPLHTDLGPTLRALSARCPDALRLVPAVGYAHATLGPADPARHLLPLPGKLPGPLRYTVGLPTYTSYSVRLQILPSGWDELCDLFGVDTPPHVHVTLGYPSERIADMPEVEELFDGVVLPDEGLLSEVLWIRALLGEPVYSYDTVERWALHGRAGAGSPSLPQPDA